MENEKENISTIVDLKLKGFIERIERLEEEKREISEQISSIYKEAKSFDFDTKTIKKIIAFRKLEEDQRFEQLSLFKTYANKLQMILPI